ncbi:MAG: hypothetical protein WAU45_10840 [Blastocatellia bacterium]
MKRVLFASLAAAAMFVFACQPQPTNTNSKATANANAPQGTDEVAFSKEDKAVVIVITGDHANPILLVPDPITLTKSKNQKLRWCVYNNLDDDVDNVKIWDFSPSDPFDPPSPFETGAIAAGDSECTRKSKAAVVGTYKYNITVYRSGTVLFAKDPGVIITD